MAPWKKNTGFMYDNLIEMGNFFEAKDLLGLKIIPSCTSSHIEADLWGDEIETYILIDLLYLPACWRTDRKPR